MRPLLKFWPNFFYGVLAATLFACGSDDGPMAPPAVDCNATGPSLAVTGADLTGCGVDNGSIALDVTGGTGTIVTTISPQPSGSSFDAASTSFIDLEPGAYTVTVTDADNCTATSNATLGAPGGGLTYDDDIKAIVEASCAIPTCHDGSGAGLPDYNDFSQVQSRANNNSGNIRQRVKSGDMPRSGSLTAAEITSILCWIDDGAPRN